MGDKRIIMKIYGYKKDDNNLMCLEETTVQCTYEELSKLAQFFKDSLDEFAKMKNDAENAHIHFRDWSDSWTEEDSDFIIAIINDRG